MVKIYLTPEDRRAAVNARYNAWAHRNPDKIREKNRRYREKRKALKAAAEADNNVNERED